MSLMPGFYMIVTEIVSICRRLIGDTSPMGRSRSSTFTIIWKIGFRKIVLPGKPEKVPTLENLCHQENLTDLNDSNSS